MNSQFSTIPATAAPATAGQPVQMAAATLADTKAASRGLYGLPIHSQNTAATLAQSGAASAPAANQMAPGAPGTVQVTQPSLVPGAGGTTAGVTPDQLVGVPTTTAFDLIQADHQAMIGLLLQLERMTPADHLEASRVTKDFCRLFKFHEGAESAYIEPLYPVHLGENGRRFLKEARTDERHLRKAVKSLAKHDLINDFTGWSSRVCALHSMLLTHFAREVNIYNAALKNALSPSDLNKLTEKIASARSGAKSTVGMGHFMSKMHTKITGRP